MPKIELKSHCRIGRGFKCVLIPNDCSTSNRGPSAKSSLKPWSDIRCNRFATSPRLTISTNRRGRNKVLDRLQRSRRLVGDLAATKSVAARFLNMHKRLAATDLVADRSRQNRRPVPDQSPTSRRPIAD